MELASSWRIEGRAEGRAEGVEEGKTEGKTELVTRIMAKRFGAAASELETRLQTLNAAQLDAFGVALLDFTHLEEAEAWIAMQEANTQEAASQELNH